MAGSFEASVKQFTIEAKENTNLIFRTAADSLAKEVIRPTRSGGNLPFDTGNLGRSLAASTSVFPGVDTENRDYGESNVEFTIAGVEAGDTLYLGFQAVYAARQNYGFVGQDSLGRNYNQSGHYFVERAGDMWQLFVSEAEAQFGE